MAACGPPRTSTFWSPEPANAERLKRALSVLEDDAAREIEEGDLQKYTVVRVADEVLVDLSPPPAASPWLESLREDGGR